MVKESIILIRGGTAVSPLIFLIIESVILSIFERTEFRLDGQALLAFLDATDDLGVDIKRLREGDDLVGHLGTHVDLHAVTHVEHLVHLLPIGADRTSVV